MFLLNFRNTAFVTKKQLFPLSKQTQKFLIKPINSFSNNLYRKRLFNTYNSKRFAQYDPKDIPSLNRFSNYNNNSRSNNIKNFGKLFLFGSCFMAGTFLGLPFLKDYIPKDSNMIIYPLVGLNLAVFGLWHIRLNNYPYQRKLAQTFLLQKNFNIFKLRQLVFSAFSHREFWHLGCNMLCLISFSAPLISLIGNVGYLSLYFNSLMLSSLLSVLYPNLLKTLFKRVSSTSFTPSLGASGALFGVFGTFAYMFPNAHLSLFFIPLPFGAWEIFLGSMGFNLMGVLLRVGSFDFLAHLGGSIMGVLYGMYFQDIINKRRMARKNKEVSIFDIFK
ncbi:hypothetical protein ACO0SA_000685 [Hanseniaspora valbyensis]